MRAFSFFLLVLAAVLIFISCKKEIESNHALYGSWELRRAVDLQHNFDTIYSPGNRNIITYKESDWEQYDTGVLVRTVLYRIVRDTSAFTHLPQDMIEYKDDNGGLHYVLFTVVGDSLSLQDNYVGGWISLHKKVGRQ